MGASPVIGMRVRLCCLLVLVCVLSPSLAHGIDGNAWIKQPENARAVYFIGLWDGWAYLQSEGEAHRKGQPDAAPGYIDSFLDGLKDCHKEKPMRQLIAIVEKYMKDHPESWHYSMGSLVVVALGDSCIK
jgi:hypothetical protein